MGDGTLQKVQVAEESHERLKPQAKWVRGIFQAAFFTYSFGALEGARSVIAADALFF